MWYYNRRWRPWAKWSRCINNQPMIAKSKCGNSEIKLCNWRSSSTLKFRKPTRSKIGLWKSNMKGSQILMTRWVRRSLMIMIKQSCANPRGSPIQGAHYRSTR
jgi:hypothetical protein